MVYFKKSIKGKRSIFILMILVIVSFFSTYIEIPVINEIDQSIFELIMYNNPIKQDEEMISVIIVGDRTIDAFKKWPIDRTEYGKLLNKRLMHSKAVIFDFLFPDKSTEVSDAYFAQTMKNHGQVVLSYLDNFDGQSSTFPIDIFLDSSKSIGYVNYIKDDDGFVRKYLLFDKSFGVLRKSLLMSTLEISGYEIVENNHSFAITEKATSRIISTFEYDDNDQATFFVLPSSEENIKVYELVDVLDQKYADDTFNDKIVLIGGSFVGASDTINMPNSPVIGVHFLLNAMNTLYSGTQPQTIHFSFQFLINLINILIVYFSLRRIKLRYSIYVPLLLIAFNITVLIFISKTFLIQTHIAYIIFIIIIAMLSGIIDRILFRDERLRRMESSIDEILNLDLNTIKNSNFTDYVKSLESNILHDHGYYVIEYLIDAEDNLIKTLYDNEDRKLRILKDKIVIPLSSLNRKGQNEFLVLGYKKKINLSELKYIASLFMSAYVFFKYSTEYQRKNELLVGLFKSMISAVDAKDPITSFHSKKVADFSVRLGKIMGYDDEMLEKLHFAGIIHDIGKIGIPDRILNKASFFSQEDRKVMESHPLLGLEITSQINIDKEIKLGISQHHERIDGKGYPNGLKGDEISEIARIIKIADVYDALTSERQYKKAWTMDRVCDLLYEGIGTEFDEKITLIALEEIKPEGWKPTSHARHKGILSDYVKNKIDELMSKVLELHKHQILNHMNHVNQMNNKFQDDERYQLIRPTSIDFSFEDYNDFGSISLGESYSKSEWLYTYPVCVSIEKDREVIYYYKQNKGIVKGFTYVFLRSYLNVVVLNSGTGDEKNKFIANFESYGLPVLVEDEMTIWDLGKMFICLYSSETSNCAYAMYFNKYFLQG